MLKKNSDGKYVCCLCHGDDAMFDSVRSLGVHLSKCHKVPSRDYYDGYARDAGEGQCRVCGSPTKFRSLGDGYSECCSRKCAQMLLSGDSARKYVITAKRERTCMERYGTTNGGGTADALAKAKATNVARRGVEWAMQDASVVAKSAETCLERYSATTYRHSDAGEKAVGDVMEGKFGRRNFFEGKDGAEAARDGYRRKHGVDHNMHDPEFVERWRERQFAENGGKYFVQTDRFRELSRDTQFARYGTWYSASAEGRAEYRKAMTERFGVPEYFQTDEFRNKSEKTNIERRGVPNPSQCPEVRAKRQETMLERFAAPTYPESDEYARAVIDGYRSLLAGAGCSFIVRSGEDRIRYACNACGAESDEQVQFVKFRVASGVSPCTSCVCKNMPVSFEEKALADYIESLGFTVEHHDKGFLGPYGADIVVDSKNTIFEYDGIYWHSELYRGKNYHLEKTLLAERSGYRLIHVFSDEWIYRKDIVKSRIRHILGVDGGTRVYARKCTVDEVSAGDARKFIDRNHIQGGVNSKWRYGLFNDGRLVSIMTFGKSRFDDTVELMRFCSDMDVVVVGGAGKLFSKFIAEHPEIGAITSYADVRWSTGHAFYEKLGFSLEAMSAPGYFIVDEDRRRNRFQFQRHRIAKVGDAGKTEHEITLERHLYRIYDCGQYRYVWKRVEKSEA